MMTTYRVAKRRQYSTLDTRSLNDNQLSFRARGVLVFLLSKPDNWAFSAETVAEAGQEGRDAIRAALRELTAAGYLVRTVHRNDRGRLITETVLYEHPSDAPTGVGKPAAGGPAVGDPASGGPGPLVISSSFHEEETETKDGDLASSTQERPNAKAARELTRTIWTRREHPPGVKFIGVAKVVEGFLDAGRAPADLERALLATPAFTANCIEFTLSKQPKSQFDEIRRVVELREAEAAR